MKPGGTNDLRNGILYLKGGDLADEVMPLRNGCRSTNSRRSSRRVLRHQKVVHITW